MSSYLWDYDEKELQKTEKGRIFILERKINYGVYPSDKKKIKLDLGHSKPFFGRKPKNLEKDQ